MELIDTLENTMEPCPFCGSPGQIEHDEEYTYDADGAPELLYSSDVLRIGCQYRGCIGSKIAYVDISVLEEHVGYWNQRANKTAQPGG